MLIFLIMPLRCALCTGMGNWSAVAEHVGNKSVEQCRQHYMATYINVDSFPLPTGMPEYAHLSAVSITPCHPPHQGIVPFILSTRVTISIPIC